MLITVGFFLQFSIIAHELFHRLGLFHEDGRPDRNLHLSYVPDNDPIYNMDIYGIPFDYISVMHGGPFITFKDVYILNQMYACGKKLYSCLIE